MLTLGMILGDMRVRTEFIHAAHNPLFGGVAPAPDLERLSALIGMIQGGKGRYDLGLATDGDSEVTRHWSSITGAPTVTSSPPTSWESSASSRDSRTEGATVRPGWRRQITERAPPAAPERDDSRHPKAGREPNFPTNPSLASEGDHGRCRTRSASSRASG